MKTPAAPIGKSADRKNSSAEKRKTFLAKNSGLRSNIHPVKAVSKSASRRSYPDPKKTKDSEILHIPDTLVYTSVKGVPRIAFQKEGIPLHTLSFEQKVALIQQGIPKQTLLVLKDRYDFNLETLAKMLDITPRTIQNKPKDFTFAGSVAEKILGLSELYSYGIEVFEDRQKWLGWLHMPNAVLGNQLPVDLLITLLGMQQVKQELARIEYGIY